MKMTRGKEWPETRCETTKYEGQEMIDMDKRHGTRDMGQETWDKRHGIRYMG
jgi:hypothetical protein